MIDHSTTELKMALKNAAASGASQPEPGTPIGEALRRFVDPRSEQFDQDFVDDLRAIDADWMSKDIRAEARTMH